MFACEGGSTAVAPQTIHRTCQEQKICSVVDQTKGLQLMLHIRMYVVCHFSRSHALCHKNRDQSRLLFTKHYFKHMYNTYIYLVTSKLIVAN